ncbi:MAG: thioredoxin [Clostridia bacterium]|nr:thioredoxin [Clostridia bacterium]
MMSNVKHLTDFDFNSTIKESKVPVLVDFWAPWCSPCRMQSPILEELATELNGKVVIAKLNVDECESLALKYGVNSIPCLMVFKDGELKEQSVGLTSKAELSAMLIKYL